MKKLICIILLLGMSVSVSGCASSNVTVEDLPSENTSVIEEESSTETQTTEDIYEEVYYNKLDYIYGCVMGSALNYDTLGDGAGGIIYASYGKEKDEALNSIGYIIDDINGDSFPELVVGSMDKSLPGTERYTIYQYRYISWL